jgi:hypothetical protein
MTTLPTLSLPEYSLNIPSSGETVTYRPYLVKEEKVLRIALESTDDDQIRASILAIVETCFKLPKSIKHYTSFDVEHMFIKLRSVSVGEKVDLIHTCESCEAETIVALDLDKVTIENLDRANNLTVQILDNLNIELSYPNAEHLGMAQVDADNIINMVSSCIKFIHYGDDTFDTRDSKKDEVINFVENLSSGQFQQLAEILLDVPYSSYNEDHVCTKCGHKNNINYTGLIHFFI